jgi:hypothetical protein
LPYRAVAAHIRVSPELTRTSAANDARAAMLEEVQQGWVAYAAEGRFRGAQGTFRISPEQVREVFRTFVEQAERLEDPKNEPLRITFFAHPPPRR